MGAAMVDVRNPYTGKSDYSFQPTQVAELAATCARLRAGQGAWAALALAERTRLLREFAARIEARREPLLAALSADTGRWSSALLEVNVGAKLQREIAAAERQATEVATEASQALPAHATAQLVPHQLVGNITPWNAPVTLAFLDTFGALLAGCAVVVKPSEVTPRFIDVIDAVLAESPELAGVLAFVRGDGGLGAALVEHVDYVCFTGSVATGKKVLQAAAARFVPVSLELGGKDPLVVLEDADLDQASTAAVVGSAMGSGQNCFSIERIYVAESRYQAFLALLIEKARRVQINFPDLRKGFIGPFIFARQAEIVAAQIADAKARGAVVHTGGEIIEHGGLWCLPTVLTGVDHGMAMMREETFGPLLPVMTFRDDAEAVALANDSRYGLSAVVYGSPERAEAVARQLNAGGVSINRWAVNLALRGFEQHAFGESGFGYNRMGREGYLRFLRSKSIVRYDGTDDENDGALAREAFGVG